MGCNQKKSVRLDADGGVKALSEKTGSDENFQYARLDSESMPVNPTSFVFC